MFSSGIKFKSILKIKTQLISHKLTYSRHFWLKGATFNFFWQWFLPLMINAVLSLFKPFLIALQKWIKVRPWEFSFFTFDFFFFSLLNFRFQHFNLLLFLIYNFLKSLLDGLDWFLKFIGFSSLIFHYFLIFFQNSSSFSNCILLIHIVIKFPIFLLLSQELSTH